MPDPIVQSSAGCDVRLVQPKQIRATLLGVHTITVLPASFVPNLPALVATLITEDLNIQLRLIIAVRLHQCTSDVSEQLLLDDLQNSFHIAVQVEQSTAKEPLHPHHNLS